VVLMSPLDFLGRPRRWLWAIHRYRGTLSPAPNFAYEICLNRISDDELEGLDLSSWRGAFNGAEPVSAITLKKFSQRFSAYGLRPDVLTPVYGLAENTVGLTFPPRGREPLIDCIDRDALAETGTAVPVAKSDKALQMVACGHPLDGHEVRIVDNNGQELADRREGRVQFRGPSACRGYYRNPEATRQLFDGDWLNTGDLGYIAKSDLYLTGRSKDLIIIGGRNIYPQELEETVGTLTGIRKGNVVVFGCPDPANGREELVVVAETRETDDQIRKKLQTEIKSLTVDLLGTPPDKLLLVPPHSLLKTSSGKIRRSACREHYQRGELGKTEKLWRQKMRMLISTLGASFKRSCESGARLVYAGYLWFLFGLALCIASLVILVLPRQRWNWRPLHLLARGFLRLSFLPVTIAGRQKVPRRENCVVVANHASFFDVYLLPATLPIAFAFVAKAELQKRPLISFMLRRLGTEFVERLNIRRSVSDAQHLKQQVLSGQTLMFFPEGTFTRVAGLRGFRMGAFVTAAESGLPILPVAIRGTRTVLRDGSWFPRYGQINIQVGEPIRIPAEKQAKDSWNQALWLHDKTREYILHHCGEQDLRSQSRFDHLQNNVSSSS
jgi:1-acyl-sn-glycerol-3-phosphate acyltransferase